MIWDVKNEDGMVVGKVELDLDKLELEREMDPLDVALTPIIRMTLNGTSGAKMVGWALGKRTTVDTMPWDASPLGRKQIP